MLNILAFVALLCGQFTCSGVEQVDDREFTVRIIGTMDYTFTGVEVIEGKNYIFNIEHTE